VSDGLVVVDKPAGWTSHDVVARLRRLAGTRKVGHAGTLDPMATGVLVVGVGKATRLLNHLAAADKVYTGTIRLGAATVTDDAEGDVISTASAANVGVDEVHAAMTTLTGTIAQVPSAVSAVKVGGRRSYARVRAGEAPELAARPVTVRRFEARAVTRPEPDRLDVEVLVECSSGTYVRALARDLGASLGVGGHLRSLRRLRVGPYGCDQARTLDELAALPDPVTVPMLAAVQAALPVREVSPDEARQLGFGRSVRASGLTGVHAAVTGDGRVIALLRDDGDHARPVLVFEPAQ
jgi:tRNA pseudouridine55 synthase